MEPVAPPKKNLTKWFLWFIAMVMLTATIAFTTLGILVLNRKTIYTNVWIESVNVSSLNKAEATDKVTAIFENELKQFNVKLSFNNKTWEYPYEALGYEYLFEEAIEEAYSVGRNGNYLERFKEIYALRNYPYIINLNTTYDVDKFAGITDEIKGSVERTPKDASIKRVNGAFDLTTETLGILIDEEELLLKIEESIRTLSKDSIQIPISYSNPRITSEELEAVHEVIGEFSTTFDSKVTGRSTNISIASTSINGVLLMPNESFSFNKKTGPRGIAEGYQEAPVIVNGQLVPGVGGGICQVSTTLYNAIVRANLEVVKRQNHSLPVAYVPLGHDASVFYGYLDLEFINNKPYPIYLESYSSGSKVFVKLYSTKSEDFVIKLHSEVTETIEPKLEIKKDIALFVGERKVEKEAKKGYRVVTYKIYSTKNGEEIKREQISRDYYPPVHGLVLEGTKPVPASNQVDEKPIEVENQENKPVEVIAP